MSPTCRHDQSQTTAQVQASTLSCFKLPTENVGRFLRADTASPRPREHVDLEDGGSVKGFICEGYVASADSGYEVEDITHLRSWLDFVKQQTS